jgi:uncharacterized phage protein gp47/JayE
VIPKSNLDDRTFDDIVAEAIRLIPRYCPEWTNHNTSDPGITLIELFAWMTEMTLYRLNKVPEKTYLSLLELMGLSLVPPQSARSIIRFFPVDGYNKPVKIKSGTKIAAMNDDSDSLVFETEKSISVNSSALAACVNRSGEQWTDYCTDEGLQPFELFDTRNSVEHILYIASPAFKYLVNEHHVEIAFSGVQDILSANDEITNHLYWECWDGRAWTHVNSGLSVTGARQKDNTVYLSGPVDIQPCSVNGKDNLYLRAVLADVPEKRTVLSVNGITIRTIFGGLGFIPDMCLSNSGVLYTQADMNSSFRIFSENPGYNEIFYIAADEIFRNGGTKVKLTYTFSEVYTAGDENDNALFSYEYWDGADWKRIDQVSSDFADGTFGFKQSGEVSFTLPENITAAVVNNEEHFWIRVRLLTKDFSIGGEYVQNENGNWMWVFSSKVQSPLVSKIRITYEAKKQIPSEVFSCSNFQWREFPSLCTVLSDDEKTDNELFTIRNSKNPSLYLGFTERLAPGDMSLYFKIDEISSVCPKPALPSFFRAQEFTAELQRRLVDFVWEYWNGKEWSVLETADRTDSFHESGFVEFTTPEDMAPCRFYDKDCCWIRVTQLSGSFETVPYIQAVLLNCVYARNENTYTDEILGSGTGGPGQTYMAAHRDLLPGAVLYVDEGSIPSDNEIGMMKKDGIDKPFYTDHGSVWVRYREVENFYASNTFSRHYCVDYKTGRILFGDGQHGVNPPKRKFNIRLASYHTGGGEKGNVAAHTLQILTQAVPFIAGCDNPFPAEGGADMETVENLKSRAAGVFKSLQRAVTAEDFQWLARESSASVGRSFCLRNKDRQGRICTVIIPAMTNVSDYELMLEPSRELIRRVSAYLNERKLVGTPLIVKGPVYRSFSISLEVVFKSDVIDAEYLKRQIDRELRRSFHALEGGSGTGWEFGKDVTSGAILKLLEKIAGILSLDSLEIRDIDAGIKVEKLVLKEDELPFLKTIEISNRKESE